MSTGMNVPHGSASAQQVYELGVRLGVLYQRIDDLLDYDCSWGATGIGRFRVNILRQRGSFMIVSRDERASGGAVLSHSGASAAQRGRWAHRRRRIERFERRSPGRGPVSLRSWRRVRPSGLHDHGPEAASAGGG